MSPHGLAPSSLLSGVSCRVAEIGQDQGIDSCDPLDQRRRPDHADDLQQDDSNRPHREKPRLPFYLVAFSNAATRSANVAIALVVSAVELSSFSTMK
mmetsp:Transcript_1253/g.3176  ORF Transcript_1253/g.3176 Transcript_1253/m.3176 type:complete len:97 (-) Transcript_1253:88-378(-)